MPEEKSFNEKVDEIEARAKRLFALVVSLAGALALSVLSLLAAWHQVVDAQQAVAVNAEKITDQEVHLAVTDDRVNGTPGAPPPDPVVALEAREAAKVP